MRDVVIIGGGLTGLAAAHELEKRNVDYIIIEVKPRLGGSIHTIDQAAFHMDKGPMLHPVYDRDRFHNYLQELELSDATRLDPDGDILFRHGTGVLVDALTSTINAPALKRMAVSTLGFLEDGMFSICMENGMVLDARALIVAAPARHAERMFYTLVPGISYRLLDYRYDPITRVSLGYREMSPRRFNLNRPYDSPVAAVHMTDEAGRVANQGGVLLQAALRFEADSLPDDPVGELAALMGWPLNPDADLIATWPESDPVMWRDPDHPLVMQTIQGMLPAGVALVGSDYIPTNHPPGLDERIRQGQEAVKRVLGHLSRD